MEHSPGSAWADGVAYREQPGIGAHLDFMRSLNDRRVLVLGGPFHVGMAVVRAESPASAEALAAEDEPVRAGLLRYRVRPWLAAIGTRARRRLGRLRDCAMMAAAGKCSL